MSEEFETRLNKVVVPWSWDEKNKSCDIRISKTEPNKAIFHPAWSSGTAGIRANRPINNTICYWEIRTKYKILGTSTMWGIGTKEASIGCAFYDDLIGIDQHSWGISHKGIAYHNGREMFYKRLELPLAGEVSIGVHFDGIAGTLSFFKDGVSLGIAFVGLQNIKKSLYPMASTTAAKVSMNIQLKHMQIGSLQGQCGRVILRNLEYPTDVFDLNLPKKLKSSLLFALPPTELNHKS